jgi:hypothetical protein
MVMLSSKMPDVDVPELGVAEEPVVFFPVISML